MAGKGWKPAGGGWKPAGGGWKPSGGWKPPAWKPGGGHWKPARWRGHAQGGGGFSCFGCAIALFALGLAGALIVVLLAVGVLAGAR